MTNFIHSLVRWDHALFMDLNGRWTCGLFDRIMPVLTDFQKTKLGLFLVIPGCLAVWIWLRRGKAVKMLIGLALVLGLTDVISAKALKPWFHRLRPEHTAGLSVILREGTHGLYGFPSNHAVNMFAAAGFLTQTEPILAPIVAAAGVVISYSRVYVGAHFPIDVLGGALFGFLAGILGGLAFKKFSSRRKA